jgi:soluble lytic murein transglycosylase-like protein
MTTANHLTIRDYFDQALVGSALNKNAFSSQRADSPGSKTFHQLLTSRGNQRVRQTSSRPTGLTVVDYRNNPVRVACRYTYRTAAPNADPNAAKPNDTAAASPAINKTSSATDRKALSRAPKRPMILKKPAALASPPNRPGLKQKHVIEKSIHEPAQKYNLPAALIRGVIRAESNFDAAAVSRAGAQGLMQLMPGTARELGVVNPFDIEQNIDGGARYLRKMLDSFGGDIKVALAAYNAGPGTVEKHGGQIPPYQETARYIDRVLKFSKQRA